MEYVQGETLKEIVQRGAIAFTQVLEIGEQVADALAAPIRQDHSSRHQTGKHLVTVRGKQRCSTSSGQSDSSAARRDR